MALIDGEADPQLELHLQKCPYCRERTEALAREQKILTSRLFRISCPSAAELGEYHLHVLEPSQMLIVSQHLRECLYCKREVDQLREFLSDLAPNVNGSLLQQAKVLIAHLVSGQRGSIAAGEPTLALRGESKGPLTFEADGIVVVLDIQPVNEGRVSIFGQVVADELEGWSGAMVSLRQVDGLQTSAVVDDLGAFHSEEAFSGSVQITITTLYGVEVQIPNIDINV